MDGWMDRQMHGHEFNTSPYSQSEGQFADSVPDPLKGYKHSNGNNV